MIRPLLTQARRRLVMQTALRYALPAWSAAGIIAAAVVTLRPEGWPFIAGGVIALATVGAWLVALWQQPTLEQVALQLDETAQTHDRLATAFAFEGRPPATPMEQSALAECQQWLADFHPARWLPWQRPPGLSWLALPLVALLTLQLLPIRPGGSLARGPADPAALAAAEQLEEMAKALEAKPAKERLGDIAEALKKSAEKLRSEPSESAQKALLRELSAAEEAMKSARQQGAMNALAEAMEPMKSQPQAAEAIEALQKGQAAKAAAALDELASALAAARSGEGEESREAQMKQLEEAMDNAQKQLGEASRMGQAAAEAAEAARRGDTPGASQAMRQMSQALRESRSDGSQSAQNNPANSEEISKMLAALEAMKQGGQQQGQQGQNQGQGEQGQGTAMTPAPGKGNPGEGESGQGMGDLAGGKPGSELDQGTKANPFGAETAAPPPADLQTQVQGLLGEGQSLHTLLPSRSGEAPARTGYRELYEAAAPAAEDAVERENIPLGARLTIKRYFESIRPNR